MFQNGNGGSYEKHARTSCRAVVVFIFEGADAQAQVITAFSGYARFANSTNNLYTLKVLNTWMLVIIKDSRLEFALPTNQKCDG